MFTTIDLYEINFEVIRLDLLLFVFRLFLPVIGVSCFPFASGDELKQPLDGGRRGQAIGRGPGHPGSAPAWLGAMGIKAEGRGRGWGRWRRGEGLWRRCQNS